MGISLMKRTCKVVVVVVAVFCLNGRYGMA